jgi:hypothetical protein
MATRKEQTTQWPQEKNRQHNGHKKKDKQLSTKHTESGGISQSIDSRKKSRQNVKNIFKLLISVFYDLERKLLVRL